MPIDLLSGTEIDLLTNRFSKELTQVSGGPQKSHPGSTGEKSTAELRSGEQLLRRKLATAEALSVASQRLLRAEQGEELANLSAALTTVAESLRAAKSHRVAVTGSARTGAERHLSLVADTVSLVEQDRLRQAVLDQCSVNTSTAVVRLAAADGDEPDADELAWAIAPISTGSAMDEVLCIGRGVGEEWHDWELAALRSLADMFPQVRRRVAAEAQLAAMFQLAPTAITIRDANGDLVACNQAFLNFLGLESETAILGTGAHEFIATEDLTDEARFRLRYIAAHGYPAIELPYRHTVTDEVIWGRVSSAYLGEERGGLWIVHVEDATADVRARGEIHHRATRDSLTGLANRYALLDALEAHLATDSCSAGQVPQYDRPGAAHSCVVALLDLDDFKPVNDKFGHAAGDEILVEVGRRLRRTVRTQDLVGRYGGDEFLVLMPGASDDSQMEALSARLAAAFDDPFAVGGQQIALSGSAGLSAAEHGDTAADVIARADVAMYREKARRFGPAIHLVDQDNPESGTLVIDPSSRDLGNETRPAARG